jgi:SagB-type dehydrogenase family enzyme
VSVATVAAQPAATATSTTLPSPRLDGAGAVERALAQRRSLRSFADRPLALTDAGQLLWAAQGVSDPAQGRRTAPSAGATYPLVLYLVAGRVDGLAAGSHRYDAASHRLTAVATGDLRAAIAGAARDQRWIADAPALVVIAAQPQRTAARYGARAERYVAIEAGAAAQNLLLQAVALGLGGTLVGAFDEAALKRVVPLGDGEQPLAIVAVGYPR